MTDDVEFTDNNEAKQASDSAEPEKWFWAENVPGNGPRPDFLPEKFQTVADAAKARADLEKRLGSFTGSPEQYNIEHLELDPEQHTLKSILDWGKKHNLNQSGLDELVGTLMSSQEAEESVSLEEAVTSMGEEGPRLMRQFKNFHDHHLQPEEQEVVKAWIKTPDELRVFNEIIKGIYAKRLPTDNSMFMGNNYETVDSIKKEMTENLERYKKDKVYREDLRNRIDWADKRAKRNQ